jgi:hypothetical protein
MILVKKSGGVPHAVPEAEAAKLPGEWTVLGKVGSRAAEASGDPPAPSAQPRKSRRKKND